MISVHNWTKGNDRSSDGRIIENNWANCGFEKLASSALWGWNLSMWRGERWTEEKPDLNDNEQNTHLHFAPPRGIDLLIWIISLYMSLCYMHGRRWAPLISASSPSEVTDQPEGLHPVPGLKSLSKREEGYLCGKSVLESVHKCVNVALGMWVWDCERECVHIWNIFNLI